MTQDPRQNPGQPFNPFPSPYAAPDASALPYATAGPNAYDPYAALLAPGRKAGLMLLIVGGLMLACGACVSVVMKMIIDPPSGSGPEMAQFNAARTQFLNQLQAAHATPKQALWLAMGTLVIGLIFVILGVPVRRGVKWAIWIAMVVDALLIVLQGLQFVQQLVQIISSGQFQLLLGLAIGSIPLVLFIVMFILLLQANRATSGLAAAQEQYRQQLWYYQQQQQLYAQGGAMPPGYGAMPPGYGAMPPPQVSAFQPPPPPSQTPPQPPTTPPGGGAT